MFWERFRSSVVIVIVTVAALVIGRELLFGICAVISLIGLSELFKTVDTHKKLPGIFGYIAGAGYMALVFFDYDQKYALPYIIGYLMVLMAVYVFAFPKYNSEQITMTFLGLIYVCIMLSFIYKTRMLDNGIYIVWLIFVGSWISDTCAYCTGMLIGKHKLPSKVSPKKSIEGCVGGVVGAALIGALYAVIAESHLDAISSPVIAFAVIGACSSVISQIGDLAASAIKRNKGIKDYGKLIPGHGGILDRFDSVIFTAPIVFYLSYYVFL